MGNSRKASPRTVKASAAVQKLRRAMLGREEIAAQADALDSTPMDLMLMRGWLPDDLHRAARVYGALFVRAKLTTAALGMASHEATTQRFDPAEGDQAAIETLRALWATLTSSEAQLLLDTCIRNSWPEWVVFRLAGREVPPVWDVKRERLMGALRKVANAIPSASPPAADGATRAGDEVPARVARTQEEPV